MEFLKSSTGLAVKVTERCLEEGRDRNVIRLFAVMANGLENTLLLDIYWDVFEK